MSTRKKLIEYDDFESQLSYVKDNFDITDEDEKIIKAARLATKDFADTYNASVELVDSLMKGKLI